MSSALSETDIAAALRQAGSSGNTPWRDALQAAQSAAASAHAQVRFWTYLRHIVFTRDIELHPKLTALFALWSAKCGTAICPARDRFTVAELRPWLGHLALLEQRDGDVLFRVCGTELIARFGCEATGRMLASLCAPHAGLRAAHAQARETFTPVPAITVMMAGDEPVTWSEIVLPLSDDGCSTSRFFLGSYPLQAPPR
jgi:hypothetical protein